MIPVVTMGTLQATASFPSGLVDLTDPTTVTPLAVDAFEA